MKWLLFSALVLMTGLAACKKETSPFSNIPLITYNGMRSDSLHAGSSEDTLFISFKFQDGDADLGNDPGSGNYDIYLKGNKDTNEYKYYFPPQMLEGITDLSKGISGTCNFYIPAAVILISDTAKLRDTVNFTLYIKDRALNNSNTIKTGDLILLK